MKKILIIFLFLFNLQSLTKADDISDFEIEGMSIGDSALDYFSKEEINKTKKAPRRVIIFIKDAI